MEIQVKPLSTHWPIRTILDTLCTILLSCKSSQICTIKLYLGVIHGDQYLAGMIFAYQTTLLVIRIRLLIVARDTPSPRVFFTWFEVYILCWKLHLHSNRYRSLLWNNHIKNCILSFWLCAFRCCCLFVYDDMTLMERNLSSSASFDPVFPLLYFPSSLAPLSVRSAGDKAFFFHFRPLWVGKTGNINSSTSIENTPRETELQLTNIR